MARVRDVLINSIYAEIHAYRHRDFATFLMVDISLVRSSNASEITFGHRRRVGYTSYELKPWNSEAKTLTIVCNKHVEGPIIIESTRRMLHTILDGVDRLMNPLDETWLPQQTRRHQARQAYEKWWSGNGKHFHFLDLPPELRNTIYSFILPHRVQWLPQEYPAPEAYGPYEPRAHLAPSLFTVNRQIGNEALQHSYLRTTRAIRSNVIWKSAMNSDSFLSNIRCLELELNRSSFMKLFNFVNPYGQDPWSVQYLDRRPMLRSMTLLHVTIRLVQYLGKPFHVPDPTCRTMKDSLCLEMIMRHFGGQRKIDVIGMKDQSQVAAFGRACKRVRTGYERWRTKKAGRGPDRLKLNHYDDWVLSKTKNPDGGVFGWCSEDDANWYKLCDEGVRCICATPCAAAMLP